MEGRDQDLARETEAADVARKAAALRDRLEQAIEPIVCVHRCQMVSLEYRREPIGWVLRVYIERAPRDPALLDDGQTVPSDATSTFDANFVARGLQGPDDAGSAAQLGVTLADCVAISRDLSVAMDVAELIPHAYHLEVSSPGLERPLVRPRDYVRFAGHRAKVQLAEPLEAVSPGRRTFRGVILGLANDAAPSVRMEEQELGKVVLPLASVVKAHLLFEDAPKPKPGKFKRSPSRNESPGASTARVAGTRAPDAHWTAGNPAVTKRMQRTRRP